MLEPLRVAAIPTIRAALACGLLVAASASTSTAETEAPDYAAPGPYAAIGFALGSENYRWLDDLNRSARAIPRMVGPAAVTGYSMTSLLGVHVLAGQRLTQRIAVDASFTWARADFFADLVTTPAPGVRVRSTRRQNDLSTWILAANARYYLLTGRIQPSVVAGVGAMKATPVDAAGARTDTYGFASRLGVGLDLHLTRHVAIAGEGVYVFGTGDTRESSALLFSASVMWRY